MSGKPRSPRSARRWFPSAVETALSCSSTGSSAWMFWGSTRRSGESWL
jgi:hypothetical protein